MLDLVAFVAQVPDGEVELFDVAEPGVALGLGYAGVEVVFDGVELCDLTGVDLEKVAAQAGVFVCAVGAVGPAAGAEGDTAAREVLVELVPLLLGGFAVLGGWP